MSDFSQRFEIIYKRFFELAAAENLPNSKIDLARMLGISQGRLQHWERGQIPRPDDLIKIHNTLGFSYSWMLTGDGDPLSESASAGADALKGHADSSAEIAKLKNEVAMLRDELAEADRINRKLTARLLINEPALGVGGNEAAAG